MYEYIQPGMLCVKSVTENPVENKPYCCHGKNSAIADSVKRGMRINNKESQRGWDREREEQ